MELNSHKNSKLQWTVFLIVVGAVGLLLLNRINEPEVVSYGLESYAAEEVPSCSETSVLCVPLEFPTVQACVDEAQPGNTCYISPGNYSGFTTKRNGDISNLITILGAGPSNTTILNSRIYLLHSYHKITGLKIQGNYMEVRDIGAHHNSIDGNEFTGGVAGIYMKDNGTNDGSTGPAHNLITNNSFYTPTGNGMVTLLGHDNLVAYNTFRDGAGYDALRVWGLNQTIKNNQFLRIITDQVATGGNHADIIQTFDTSMDYIARGIIFEGNFIKDSTSQFGNLSNGGTGDLQDWTFRNNLFINSRLQLNNYLPNVKIYNNTSYGAPVEFSNGFRFAYSDTVGSADNGQVYNNILIGDGGFYGFNVNTTGGFADYNIIANLDGSAKSAPQEGPHGINGNIQVSNLFVDLINGNLQLKNGSVAIDAGVALTGFSYDFNNTPRPQGLAWDIGAYEYSTGTTPPPPPTPTPTPTPTPPSIDTEAPVVSINSPLNNTTVTRLSTVTVSATATDNTSVTSVSFYLNGSLISTDTTFPYTATWKVPGAKNKIYKLTANAKDPAGNIGASTTVNVTSK